MSNFSYYERYVKLRDEHGLTDYKVSQGTGIGQSTFSDWKNQIYVPKLDKLIKIANFFGVSIEYFTNEECGE